MSDREKPYTDYDFRYKGRVVSAPCPRDGQTKKGKIVSAGSGYSPEFLKASALAEVREAGMRVQKDDMTTVVYIDCANCPLNGKLFFSSHRYDLSKTILEAKDQAVQACLRKRVD
jgi:hypothetical protein